MLNFYNVPASAPKSAGSKAKTKADARAQTESLWTPWFKTQKALSAPSMLSGLGIGAVALAMSRINRPGLPFKDAKAYCSAFLTNTTGAKPHLLSAKPWLKEVSPELRRTTDETIAYAMTVAVAANQGYMFIGSRSDVNRLLSTYSPEAWSRIWDDDGPDYLLANGKSFAFIEVKGRALPERIKPYSFAAYKTQSLNARICLANKPFYFKLRRVLSYVNLPANGRSHLPVPASVQWFNARDGNGRYIAKSTFESWGQAVLTTAVVLAEVSAQCLNQGTSLNELIALYKLGERGANNGPRRLHDERFPIILLPVEGSGAGLAVGVRVVKLYSKMLSMLTKDLKSDNEFEAHTKDMEKLLIELSESSVLSATDIEALVGPGLAPIIQPPFTVLATGIFTVTFKAKSPLNI